MLCYDVSMNKPIDILEDREQSNRLGFIAYIIPEFARQFKMNSADAYQYLKKYGGIDFIFEHWWTLHVDNPILSCRDIYEVCLENGGMR